MMTGHSPGPETDLPDNQSPSTVLVVEDETLVRMVGTVMLEDAGYEVLEAGDADEALKILEGHQGIHLLFSDVDMPGSMNGLDLATLVHERWPNIRLLITSGHHQLNNSRVPGDGQFVPKPWTQGDLVGRVREMLVSY
jgi:CheY-like chemotaxis protein